MPVLETEAGIARGPERKQAFVPVVDLQHPFSGYGGHPALDVGSWTGRLRGFLCQKKPERAYSYNKIE
jgi:hypothetical protein